MQSICDLSQPLSPDGYAPNVIRAALYFVQNCDSFDTALSESLAFAGITLLHTLFYQHYDAKKDDLILVHNKFNVLVPREQLSLKY